MVSSFLRTRFPSAMTLSLSTALLAAMAFMPAQPVAAQDSDAFLDPAAGRLFRAAQGAWWSIDSSVVRYTSVIKQRIAAGIRTPLKDRTIYRNETAVRAFWDRDHPALIQVMGARSQYPGREEATEGALGWLNDLTIDDPFEPGGDRLFFGLTDSDDPDFTDPNTDDFWFCPPIGPGC